MVYTTPGLALLSSEPFSELVVAVPLKRRGQVCDIFGWQEGFASRLVGKERGEEEEGAEDQDRSG